MIFGVWLATLSVDKEARRRNLSSEVLSNLVFIGLIAGVVGARIGYALRHLDAYLDSLLDIFAFNTAALSIGDGLIFGLLAALAYGQRKELPLWPTIDVLIPGLSLFSIFIGLSNLASGDAYGAPASLPWSIELWGAARHPSQVYETAAALLVFVIVHRLKFTPVFPGFLALTFFGLSAANRVFLEAFRGDSEIVIGNIRSMQLLGLLVLFLSLVGIHLLAKDAVDRKLNT
jgi:prolipoprotein diacylglyceryltransferase